MGKTKHDVVFGTDNDSYTVSSGDRIEARTAAAALTTQGSGQSLNVDGTIDGGDRIGLLVSTGPKTASAVPYHRYDFATGSLAITVGKTGTVSGGYGIDLSVPLANRDPARGDGGSITATLSNAGHITATEGPAIIADERSTITSISNATTGLIGGISAIVTSLTNAGTIDGGASSALDLVGGNETSNAGTITASGKTATVFADTLNFTNTGLVSATGKGSAIVAQDLDLTNSADGTIEGGKGGSLFAGHSLTLHNKGTITGTVAGGSSDDVIDNRGGTIDGDVRLGAGYDSFVASLGDDGSIRTGVTGTLDGGDGYDELSVKLAGTVMLSANQANVTGFEALVLDRAKGTDLTIAEGVGSALLLKGDGHVVNDADILGGDAAITLYDGTTGTTDLVNNGDISIDGTQYGAAITLEDSFGPAKVASFINTGSITAKQGGAVLVDAALVKSFNVENDGDIKSDYAAFHIVLAGTKSNTVLNTGTIHSNFDAALYVSLSDRFSGDGLTAPSASEVTNSGILIGGEAGALVGGADFHNHGQITGGSGEYQESVDFLGNIGSSLFDMDNDGTIKGGTAIIFDGGTLTNSGTIKGSYVGVEVGSATAIINEAAGVISGGATAIDASGSGVHLTNEGTIKGAVTLGYLDDNYQGAHGSSSGTISGGGGSDTLVGGDDRTALNGDYGDDTLTGNGGRDTLNGGDGNDVISGGTGRDQIDGGTGDDTIDAGEGNDTIHFGLGADLVTGGVGKDQFVVDLGSYFYGTATSTIEDFVHRQDVVDFRMVEASQLNGSHFTWLSQRAFTATGVAELRFDHDGSATHLYADFDGDGAADFQLDLAGDHHLHVTDVLI